MASAAATRRRGSANNARIAAKQRRQKILVVVLVAALAVILAWEVPNLRARSSGSSLGGGTRRTGRSGSETRVEARGWKRRRSVRTQVAVER